MQLQADRSGLWAFRVAGEFDDELAVEARRDLFRAANKLLASLAHRADEKSQDLRELLERV